MFRTRARRMVFLALVGVMAMLGLAIWGWRAVRTALHPPLDKQPVEQNLDPDSLDCIPTTPPRDVGDLNEFVGDTRRLPGFIGADVGASVELSDGRSLWVFGDTLRTNDFGGSTFVHNSMLLISDTCATVVLPEDRDAIVPDRSDGVGYWPISIDKRALADHDVVGVGLLRVKVHGSGPWDFQILGSSIARFEVPRNGVPELIEVIDIGPDQIDDNRPTWGAAVAVVDDWVYIYGTAHPDDPDVYGWSLHVARVPLDGLTDLKQWTYWDGTRWSRSEENLGTLIPARDGVARALSVFEQDGEWYAVSKRNAFLGTDLVVWKAASPTGPFTPGPSQVTIPSADGVLQYMPLAHPHLLPEKGTVIVSWSRNIADLTQIAEDPTLYRPEFARIDLP